MKKYFLGVFVLVMSFSSVSYGQLNLKKAASGANKVMQAAKLSDAQMAEYVKEYIDWMDEKNTVCDDNDPYAIRLKKLTEGLDKVDGIPLNFKVYNIADVNAFACPDGSVRIFSSLMDIMTDDELVGIIGHEIGHIANRDSKDAYRRALLTSALKDGIASTGNKAAALSDSQLGELGESLINASYSKKQEHAADLYGYNFLKERGRNPWAMALSFECLRKMSEETGAVDNSKISQLFSTHPDLEVRIEKMSQKATSEGFTRP